MKTGIPGRSRSRLRLRSRTPVLSVTAAMAVLASGAWAAQAQVLYDPALGTLPNAQGWSYAALPGGAQTSFGEGAAQLSTLSAANILAGFSRVAPAPLDRTTGFVVAFTFQLLAEDHGNRVDRAGLSVTVLGSDRRGIELGFWTDRIWAQSDSPMFTHAEEALWNVTAARTAYTLTLQGDQYTLAADGLTLLTGAVRDYTPFTGFIDPYETPNFLFVGDNTTSARASFALGRIELLPVRAEPPALRVEGIAGGGLRLSWPVGSGAWTLAVRSRLESEAPWQPVERPVQTVDGWNQVDLTPDNAVQFYRLQ